MYTSELRSQQELSNYSLNPAIKGIMDENNPIKLAILNYIIYLSTIYMRVEPSQITLAAKFGVSRQWVNRLLARWKSIGVLTYKQYKYNRSCIYFLNPLIAEHKKRIAFKVPAALKLFAVSSLCVAVFGGELTLNNIRKYLYKKNEYEVGYIKNEGYDFYEKGYGSETQYIHFYNNPMETIENYRLCPKEMVMSQQAIVSIISQAYDLSPEQENRLLEFSFEALEYARKELYRQQKQNSLSSSHAATSWFAAVASGFERKNASHPKTGRGKGFNNPFVQKIVQGSFNPNHSPSAAPKMSIEERKAFLLSEIPKIEDLIAQAESGRTMYGGADYGRKMLANIQQELKDMEKMYVAQDPEYEQYLDEISKDKSNPAGYKDLVKKYNDRRVHRVSDNVRTTQ